MAEAIEAAQGATEAEAPQEPVKQGYRVIPWTTRMGLSIRNGFRAVKMIEARCDDCQAQGNPLWFQTCEHDPYHSTQTVEQTTPILEEDEDGNQIVVGETKKILYKRQPNVTQVPVLTRVGSGLQVQEALSRGWKLPEQVDPNDKKHLGYAPMCQFSNCYSPNPQHKYRHGDYCNNEHAAMAKKVEAGEPLEALDDEKFYKDLEKVELR